MAPRKPKQNEPVITEPVVNELEVANQVVTNKVSTTDVTSPLTIPTEDELRIMRATLYASLQPHFNARVIEQRMKDAITTYTELCAKSV